MDKCWSWSLIVIIQAIVTIGQETSSSAPTEQPGKRRTAEMKLLYGKDAAMIHGMETAMQLNYDRNCDRKNPQHWPNIPLNIKFSWITRVFLNEIRLIDDVEIKLNFHKKYFNLV